MINYKILHSSIESDIIDEKKQEWSADETTKDCGLHVYIKVKENIFHNFLQNQKSTLQNEENLEKVISW